MLVVSRVFVCCVVFAQVSSWIWGEPRASTVGLQCARSTSGTPCGTPVPGPIETEVRIVCCAMASTGAGGENATAAAAVSARAKPQTQQLVKKKKAKRLLKIAPRFYRPDDFVLDARAVAMNAENVTHLQDVFTTATCRCFILKSFSDANFHKSLKYGVWSSTYAHNMVLDQVFKSEFSALRPVLFFFSVCGSKHFNGIARMTSGVRTDVKFPLWEKPKYEGFFHVEWLQVKDVPNFVLTDIKMSNTPTKKSITSCRDCEEVLFEEANRFIETFVEYPSRSSAWDDYEVFEKQQPVLEKKRGLIEPVDPLQFVPLPVMNT